MSASPSAVGRDLASLATVLRLVLIGAFATAVGGVVLPGAAGSLSAWLCLGLLVGAPVVRVAWLTLAWLRSGDLRFAILGIALLGVLAVSGVVALI